MTLKKILPDAFRTLTGLAHQGYTPQTAIADIIDNSIAAKATRIHVIFKPQLDGSTIVQIVDNGIGMDLPTLEGAMQIGSSSRLANSSLSVYGMGMKAASMSFSPKFTVVSKNKKSNIVEASWDIEQQIENPWTIEIGEAKTSNVELFEDLIAGEQGTIVTWDNADFKEAVHEVRKIKGAKRKGDKGLDIAIRDYLAMAFHRFISGNVDGFEKIEFFFNSEIIDAWNPVSEKYLSPAWKPIKDEFETSVLINGQETLVPFSTTTYVLKGKDEYSKELFLESRLSMKFQGIYPYREDRLLQSPDWLDTLTFHPDWNNLRVILELDPRLDSVTRTDMKKSGLTLSPDMWEQIREKLSSYSTQLKSQKQAKKNKKRTEIDTRALHDPSNRKIAEISPELEKPITVLNDDGTAVITSKFGESFTELSELSIPLNTNSTRVQPVSDLNGGVLFEPVMKGSEQVILLNKSHPFYQKIYLGLYGEPLAIQGFDFLLYSLAHAEFLTRTDRLKEQFRRMRMEMSESLRMFVLDLDDPSSFDEENGESE